MVNVISANVSGLGSKKDEGMTIPGETASKNDGHIAREPRILKPPFLSAAKTSKNLADPNFMPQYTMDPEMVVANGPTTPPAKRKKRRKSQQAGKDFIPNNI